MRLISEVWIFRGTEMTGIGLISEVSCGIASEIGVQVLINSNIVYI